MEREAQRPIRADISSAISQAPFRDNPALIKRTIDCLEELIEFVMEKGQLPSGFRPIRGGKPIPKNLSETTHASTRNWGWLGRNNCFVFVQFRPRDSVDPIKIIAILPLKTQADPLDRGRIHDLQDKRGKRAIAARYKRELPRFRL